MENELKEAIQALKVIRAKLVVIFESDRYQKLNKQHYPNPNYVENSIGLTNLSAKFLEKESKWIQQNAEA